MAVVAEVAVEALPFKNLGRVVIFCTYPYYPVHAHRDWIQCPHRDHHINFTSRFDRGIYVYDEIKDEKVTIRELSAIKSSATRKIKEEMFGKEKKTRSQKKADNKLKQAKEKEERGKELHLASPSLDVREVERYLNLRFHPFL